MYSLNTIRAINAPATPAKPGRCTFSPTKDGVIISSAFYGRKAFIGAEAGKQLLVLLRGTNSGTKHDELIEAQFRSAPTGKQRLVA